ncbi:MAG: hypothetical protein ACTSP4_12835 [Candidatus Hodarchaeales archaeon]
MTKYAEIESKMLDAFKLIRSIEKNIQEINPKEILQDLKEFNDDTNDPIPMIAIDGSSRFFWKYPSAWTSIGLTRVVAVIYSIETGAENENNADKLKINDCITDDKIHTICTAKMYSSTINKVHKEFFSLSKGNEAIMLSDFMRLHELKHAIKVAAKRKDELIVLDGALNVKNSKTFKDTMDKLIDVCDANNHILVGVSKESSIPVPVKFNIHEDLLNSYTRHLKGNLYIKVPPPSKETKFLQYGDVYFARLHEAAVKWFRIDIYSGCNHEKVLGYLSDYARTKIIPGYPYPLIDAHDVAVGLRQFPEFYENLFIEKANESNFDISAVVKGFTRTDGQHAGAFHELLDKIAKKG